MLQELYVTGGVQEQECMQCGLLQKRQGVEGLQERQGGSSLQEEASPCKLLQEQWQGSHWRLKQ